MTKVAPTARTLVFISHATPQDNDFTLWLSSRLASAGYLVWSDLTKLIGGETHWDDIADDTPLLTIQEAGLVAVHELNGEIALDAFESR